MGHEGATTPDPRASAFEQRVTQMARRSGLWSPGQRVLVALSGGADSVALLRLLERASREDRLSLVAAHVNYGRRGAESEGDEAFCRALCEGLRIPLLVKRAHAAPSTNFQAWARRQRHMWFLFLSTEQGYDRVALGHTANDRAETLILQWFRGAGRRGVANMWPRFDRTIRPLLDCERREIVDYLSWLGQAYRTDSSNASPKYRRNRIRNEVLPLLDDIFNTNAARTLAASARLFGLEEDYLDAVTRQHLYLLEFSAEGVRMPVEQLRALPPALALRLLRYALGDIAQTPRRATLFRLLDLAGQPVGNRLKVSSDCQAERGREHLWIYSESAEFPELQPTVPGRTNLPDGSRLTVIPHSGPDFPRGDFEIVTQPQQFSGSLHVRPARAGDRMHPFGAKGSRLVFDLLAEAGVPRNLRKRSWVLTDESRILWLLGHRQAEETRVLPEAGPVYQFRWESDTYGGAA
jgi:tRNA(Ile)-lysidine synthase